MSLFTHQDLLFKTFGIHFRLTGKVLMTLGTYRAKAVWLGIPNTSWSPLIGTQRYRLSLVGPAELDHPHLESG